jgi:hypothetical protein
VFYVADVAALGPVMNGELHVALDDADFVGVPLAARAHRCCRHVPDIK